MDNVERHFDKGVIIENRKRKIQGSFGWIEHRFLRSGYMEMLNKREMLLYFFLALVSDKNGISFYGSQRSMAVLQLDEAGYFQALAGLENKDFICREGNKVQVLSLPEYNNRTEYSPAKRYNRALSFNEIISQSLATSDHVKGRETDHGQR